MIPRRWLQCAVAFGSVGLALTLHQPSSHVSVGNNLLSGVAFQGNAFPFCLRGALPKSGVAHQSVCRCWYNWWAPFEHPGEHCGEVPFGCPWKLGQILRHWGLWNLGLQEVGRMWGAQVGDLYDTQGQTLGRLDVTEPGFALAGGYLIPHNLGVYQP